MGRLTAAMVRSLSKPGRYGDGAGSTLYLVVQRSGARSWVQRLVIDRKRHDIGLGGATLVTLKEARERAFANRKLARDGGDPLAAKRRTQVPTFQEAAARTFEAIRARWRSAKTAGNWSGALERYAFPVFGGRRVDKIGREDVLRVLTPIWTAKPEAARKLRRRIRTVLQWAEAHGHVDRNVAGDAIDGALPAMPAVKQHHRALPYAEVAAALETIEASRAGLAAKACLRYLVLTACRSGEARGATWAEIDLEAGEWRIPAARMKAGVEHRVPLSPAALAVLEAVRRLRGPADLVFPSPSRPSKPLSDMTLTKVLRSTRLAGRATVRGFRTSFRTWTSERTGVPHAVAEAALAHAVGSAVERSYARSDLFEKRRALMNQWAQFVTGGGAQVVRLHR